MNIVYTINGEGMGHASRSAVVIDHLIACGHTVMILSSGDRPIRFLREHFPSVVAVTGFHIVYEENRVRRMRTAARALSNLTGIQDDIVKIRKSLGDFHPDLVITDFDLHGQIVASVYKIPIISIDNIQFLSYASVRTEAKDLIDYEINVLIAKMMVPRADHYFITTFDPAALENPDREAGITFVPPLLRAKVLQQTISTGDHILVYQTSDSYSSLIPILAGTSERYFVYNMQERSKHKNIICKEFSEDAFIADLASAKAVITNGGFTVISEALFLQKPILSIPIAHHYEQKLNGLMLQELGLGSMALRLSSTVLTSFVKSIDQFTRKKVPIVFDNEILFRALDPTIERLAGKL